MQSSIIEKILSGIEEGEFLLNVLDSSKTIMSGQDGHSKIFGSGEGYKKLHGILVKKFPLIADEEAVNKIHGLELLTNETVKKEAIDVTENLLKSLHDVTLFVSDTTNILHQIKDSIPPEILWKPASRLLSYHILYLLSCLVRITLIVSSFDQLKFIISVYALISPEVTSPNTPNNRMYEDVKTFANCNDFIFRLQESLQNMSEHVAALVANTSPLLYTPVDKIMKCESDNHPLLTACLFKGESVNWITLALLAVPSCLRQASNCDVQYNGFKILRKILLDGYCIPVVGTQVFHTHKEFKEILKKRKLDQKDTEAKNLTSQTSAMAVSTAWLKHRENRNFLIFHGKRLLTKIKSASSITKNVNRLLCTAKLIKDELLWFVYHKHNKPTTKVSKYQSSHFSDEHTVELVSMLAQILGLLSNSDTQRVVSVSYEKLLVKLSLDQNADLVALREICDGAVRGSLHSEMCSQLTCGFFMAKLSSGNMAEWVRKMIFIPELNSFRSWYTTLLEDSMQNKDLAYCAADVVNLTKTFVDSIHPYVDESKYHENGRDCVVFAEGLLQRILTRVGVLLLQLKDTQQGLVSLSLQVNGSAAARVFQLCHLGEGLSDKKKVDSLFPNGWVVPGSESLHDNRALLLSRTTKMEILSDVVTSLHRNETITVFDKTFYLAECLRLLVINDMRKYLSTSVSSDTSKSTVNTNTLLDSVRHCHSLNFQVSQFSRISSEDATLQALLSEFSSPQCWEDRFFELPKAPSPTHNNIAYRLAKWVTRFTRHVTKEKLIFSTRRKVFVPTDSSKSVEDFFVPSDWYNLAIIGGGYVIRLVDSMLLEHIGELLQTIQKSAIKIKPICEIYESTRTIDRDMEKVIQDSSIVQETIHLSIVLLVRQLLYDGLARNISRRSVALNQAVLTQLEQDLGNPRVSLLCGTDIDSDPVLAQLYVDNLQRNGSEEFDLSHLPVAFGLSMNHSIWSRSGEFDTLRDGWKTNIHCLDFALRHIFRNVQYNPPLSSSASYNKAMSVYTRTALSVVLSHRSGGGRDDHQSFLNQIQFLKRLVRGDKSLSAKVLVDHCPHSLLREVDILTYFKGEKNR